MFSCIGPSRSGGRRRISLDRGEVSVRVRNTRLGAQQLERAFVLCDLDAPRGRADASDLGGDQLFVPDGGMPGPRHRRVDDVVGEAVAVEVRAEVRLRHIERGCRGPLPVAAGDGPEG